LSLITGINAKRVHIDLGAGVAKFAKTHPRHDEPDGVAFGPVGGGIQAVFKITAPRYAGGGLVDDNRGLWAFAQRGVISNPCA